MDATNIYCVMHKTTGLDSIVVYRIQKSDMSVKYVAESLAGQVFYKQTQFEKNSGYLYVFSRSHDVPDTTNPYILVTNYLKTNLVTTNSI